MTQHSLVNIHEEKYQFERDHSAIDYQQTKATEN